MQEYPTMGMPGSGGEQTLAQSCLIRATDEACRWLLDHRVKPLHWITHTHTNTHTHTHTQTHKHTHTHMRTHTHTHTHTHRERERERERERKRLLYTHSKRKRVLYTSVQMCTQLVVLCSLPTLLHTHWSSIHYCYNNSATV